MRQMQQVARISVIIFSVLAVVSILVFWKKNDRKSKKLDFSFKRNTVHSEEQADKATLDSLTEDLQLL